MNLVNFTKCQILFANHFGTTIISIAMFCQLQIDFFTFLPNFYPIRYYCGSRSIMISMSRLKVGWVIDSGLQVIFGQLFLRITGVEQKYQFAVYC